MEPEDDWKTINSQEEMQCEIKDRLIRQRGEIIEQNENNKEKIIIIIIKRDNNNKREKKR